MSFVESLDLIDSYLNREKIKESRIPIWLKYLPEIDDSLKSENGVIGLVERMLDSLDSLVEHDGLMEDEKIIVEEVIIWSQVSRNKRIQAIRKGNIAEASAEIFAKEMMNHSINIRDLNEDKLIYQLIKNHDLLWKLLKGESRLDKIDEIVLFFENTNDYDYIDLERVVKALNTCVLDGYSDAFNNYRLHSKRDKEIINRVNNLMSGGKEDLPIMNSYERLNRIYEISTTEEGSFENEYLDILEKNDNLDRYIYNLLLKCDLNYSEGNINKIMKIEEFFKLILIPFRKTINPILVESISFEKIYNELYSKGEFCNYKAIIIRSLLNRIPILDVINGSFNLNSDLKIEAVLLNETEKDYSINIEFSEIAENIINLCYLAEGKDNYYKMVNILKEYFQLNDEDIASIHHYTNDKLERESKEEK